MAFRLTDRDVWIIFLTPMTFASVHAVGQDEKGNPAEYTSAVMLDEFIRSTDLKTVYPAARCFGSNNPDEVPDDAPRTWLRAPDLHSRRYGGI